MVNYDIIKMICSVINGNSIDMSALQDYKTIIEMASKHHIVTLLYYVFYTNNVQLETEIGQHMQDIVFSEITINEKQLYYIDEISGKFNENNIDHIFLKGSVLKKLYPCAEMRSMSDIDILIREEQYPQIVKIMKLIGFDFAYESDHELVWKKGQIIVELHKILISTYNRDLYAYFGDGWKRAILNENNKYVFSDDDFFIYVFSHFTRHYRDAGIGIIHMCDLYVILNSYELDWAYITEELKKLHLYEFWNNIKATMDVWFNNGKSTDITDCVTNTIINSGVYGLKDTTRFSFALKSRKTHKNLFTGKICRIARGVFPSFESMIRKYPIIKKFSFLLPVFWIWRLIVIFCTRGDEIKTEIYNVTSVKDADVENYQKALKYVGLDYNF